jgi:hypothetical protein
VGKVYGKRGGKTSARTLPAERSGPAKIASLAAAKKRIVKCLARQSRKPRRAKNAKLKSSFPKKPPRRIIARQAPAHDKHPPFRYDGLLHRLKVKKGAYVIRTIFPRLSEGL